MTSVSEVVHERLPYLGQPMPAPPVEDNGSVKEGPVATLRRGITVSLNRKHSQSACKSLGLPLLGSPYLDTMVSPAGVDRAREFIFLRGSAAGVVTKLRSVSVNL